MRIRIDFADLPEIVSNNTDIPLSDALIEYIQDEYFNGAENAVKYLGINTDFEYIELELMPG